MTQIIDKKGLARRRNWRSLRLVILGTLATMPFPVILLACGIAVSVRMTSVNITSDLEQELHDHCELVLT